MLVVLSVLALFNSTVKADPAPSTAELSAYLQTHNLNVGVAAVGGYNQIYYQYNGQQIVVSSGNINHTEFSTQGAFIAWQGIVDGTGQIFLYNVLSGALTQLTTTGINESPVMYGGIVTWQIWDGSNWQIEYYDGIQISQLTEGAYSSTQSSTDGKRIIYAEQLAPNNWKVESYEISSGQTTLIAQGDTSSTAYPHFNADGTVSTAFVAF